MWLHCAGYVSTNGTNAGNKAVLLFTDGENNAGARTADDVISLAKGAGVRVFPIALADASKLELGRIARRLGGGIIDASDVRQLVSAYIVGGVLWNTATCNMTIREAITGKTYVSNGHSQRTMYVSCGVELGRHQRQLAGRLLWQ